jgi:hypothetical protein
VFKELMLLKELVAVVVFKELVTWGAQSGDKGCYSRNW